jgi:hypothetical protein
MNCEQCEEWMSAYIENALAVPERDSVSAHLISCAACTSLLASVNDLLSWTSKFPSYEAPAWLPNRILANTPVIARERWVDTVASIGRWLIEPRTAMAIFTSVVVFGWLGSIAGISPDWRTVMTDPRATYHQVVRAAFRSPLVAQIQSQIEQLREIS